MDTNELTRAVVGVPVATVVPRFVPGVAGRISRVPAVALLSLWSLAPVLDRWEAWLIIAVALGAAQTLGDEGETDGGALLKASGVALLMTVVTGALLGWSSSVDALDAGVSDGDAVVVVCGGLAAVFVGGAAIGQLLRPFEAWVTPGGSDDLSHAGLLIGWLERALLYGFVVAGVAGGGALVVAAKALARLPSLSKEDKFAEYFLIGTLASVLVAVGFGIAVRAILGLGPLLS